MVRTNATYIRFDRMLYNDRRYVLSKGCLKTIFFKIVDNSWILKRFNVLYLKLNEVS